MATTTKNKTVKTKSLNESLVNATKATIAATIENGEKWQKLTKKLIKKSEPVRRKQMDLVFDTATAVKKQVSTSTERVLDLVGYEQAMEYVSNNPVSKRVMEVSGNLKTKVNENPMVQQVGKTTENLKTKGTAKFNDIKDDVLEQAQKILNKGEEMVEGALATKKVKAPVKKTTTAKRKTTAKAATATKTAAKRPAAKRPATKRTTTAKAAAPKATAAKKVAPKAEAPVAKAVESK